MATRERLETALRNAHNAGDAKAASVFANAIRAGEYDGVPVEEAAPVSRFGGVPVDATTSGDPSIQKDQAVFENEPGLLEELDSAFQKIPGVPALAEFSAGVNRAGWGVIDFFGSDNINAVLQLAGSEKRIPEFGQLAAPEGSFMEPGLLQRSVATAGEMVPAALGIGQVIRNTASKLPGFAAGESTKAGVLREMGKATAKQDVGLSAAAGVGSEVGRNIGGETGALVGSVAAPTAIAAIPLNTAKKVASTVLKKSAPTVRELKDTARGIYNSLDSAGVKIPSSQFDDLTDDIVRTLNKEGADINLTPATNAVISRLEKEVGTDKTLSQIDTLRKVAKGAADSLDKNERRLGSIATNKIDEFLDNLGSDVVVGDKQAGAAFKSARDLWGRARRTEILDQAIVDAESQASGFENGIRTQFRAILKKINKGKLKGFTKDETAAIKKVVDGTKAGNVAKFLGKFGVLDGVTSRSLTTLGGIGVASAAGGTGAAVAVPLIGQMSGALAQRLTQNNAAMANDIIRAGKNSTKIASTYIKNTPKNKRSSSELAELFIRNEVYLPAINIKTSPELTASAAVIAAIAKENDKKED